MWKQLFTLAKQLIGLAKDTARNNTRIQELENDLEELTDKVQWLAFEFTRLAERELYGRERLALRVENELLRFERRLPPEKGKG